MRPNDLTLLAIVLLLGIVIGVVGTAGAYSMAASRQADAEQKETDETVKRLEQQLQEQQARIDKYLEDEDNKRRALEQPAGDEPRAQPAPVVAAAPPDQPEALPAPREVGSAAPAPTAPAGFRPPREFGVK